MTWTMLCRRPPGDNYTAEDGLVGLGERGPMTWWFSSLSLHPGLVVLTHTWGPHLRTKVPTTWEHRHCTRDMERRCGPESQPLGGHHSIVWKIPLHSRVTLKPQPFLQPHVFLHSWKSMSWKRIAMKKRLPEIFFRWSAHWRRVRNASRSLSIDLCFYWALTKSSPVSNAFLVIVSFVKNIKWPEKKEVTEEITLF